MQMPLLWGSHLASNMQVPLLWGSHLAPHMHHRTAELDLLRQA